MKLADHEKMPPVAALMTAFPYFVRPEDPARRAADLMQEHAIRHVPVKDGDHVVGVVSERDLRVLAGPHAATSGADLAVRDVQVSDVYTVEMSASLATALRGMAQRKIGTAIVLRSGKLAGIITVTDVCRALAEVLEGRFPAPDDATVA